MNKALSGYIFNKKIELDYFCGGVKKFIVLREPTVNEFRQITALISDVETGEMDKIFPAVEKFCEVAPNLIVDHNFTGEDEKPLGKKDIGEFISSKIEVAMFVITEYFSSIPLPKASGYKSAPTASTASKGTTLILK